MSRLSRPHIQTFQTQTFGATMQFGFKSGCGATLDATHVQTFQTLYPDFPDSIVRRDYAILVSIRMRRDPWRDSCPDFPDLISRLSRLKLSARLYNLGLNLDAERPTTQPRRRRRGFPDGAAIRFIGFPKNSVLSVLENNCKIN